MLHSLSEKLAMITIKKSCNDEKKLNILSYGYELILSQIVSILIIFLTGLVLGFGWETFLFLVSFVCLRIFCGGFHANSYHNCFISSTIITFLVVGSGCLIGKFEVFWFAIIVMIISSMILIFKGPFINSKHPLSLKRIHINMKKFYYIIFVENISILFFLFTQQYIAAYILAFSEMAVAILLLLAHMMKRKEERTYV